MVGLAIGFRVHWPSPPPSTLRGGGGGGSGLGGVVSGLLDIADDDRIRQRSATKARWEPGRYHWWVDQDGIRIGGPAGLAAALARGAWTWQSPEPKRNPVPTADRWAGFFDDNNEWWCTQGRPSLAAVGWAGDTISDPAGTIAGAVQELRGPFPTIPSIQGHAPRWLVLRPDPGLGTSWRVLDQHDSAGMESMVLLRTLGREPRTVPAPTGWNRLMTDFPGNDSGLAHVLRSASGAVQLRIETWWAGEDGWLRRAGRDDLVLVGHRPGHAATAVLPPPAIYPGFVGSPERMALATRAWSLAVPAPLLERHPVGMLAMATDPAGIPVAMGMDTLIAERSAEHLWVLIHGGPGDMEPRPVMLEPTKDGPVLELRLRRWRPAPGSQGAADLADRLGLGADPPVPAVAWMQLLRLPMPPRGMGDTAAIMLRWEEVTTSPDGGGYHVVDQVPVRIGTLIHR
jgi:hypothetical protein